MVTCFGYQIPTKTAKSSRLFVPHQLHHQSTFILWCLFHNTKGVLSELQWDTYRSWPSTSMQGCTEMFLCTEMHKKKSALALLLQSVYRVSLSPFFYFLIIIISFPSVCLSLCFRDWCPSACTASPQLVLQLPPVSMKAHYCLLLVHYYCWQRSSNCPDS